MSKFDARKKVLIAESEVYRQLLKVEIQTFKVYGARTKRRLGFLGMSLPLLVSGIPILSGLFARRKRRERFSLKGMSGMLLLGWKIFRQVAPFFGVKRFLARRSEPREDAAEEYLSKRL
jgi:hypothetical protein